MSKRPDVDNLRDRAGALSELGRHKEAAAMLAQALAAAPEDADLLCRACAAHYHLRDWKQALLFAEAAIAANPETAWGHALRSQILVVRGRGSEAVQAAEEAVRLAPHHAEYLRPLFSAYVSCKRMRDAENAALRLRELRPELHSSYEMLATIALGRQQGRQAEAYLRQALALNPASLDTLNRLGVLLTNRMRIGEAIRLLHAAVRLQPAENRARVNLGSALFALMLPCIALQGLLGAALWALLTLWGAHFMPAALTGYGVITLGSLPLHKLRPAVFFAWQPVFRRLPADIRKDALTLWRQRWLLHGTMTFGLLIISMVLSALLLAGLCAICGRPLPVHPPRAAIASRPYQQRAS